MAIIGIDHVQLAMPRGEEPAARAFYAGLLGLIEMTKPADLAANGGCWFAAPGVQVHVGVDADFRPARKAHPALLVDDLDVVVDALRAGGAELRLDEPQIEGYRRAFVFDPFGNRIELMQRL
ncbi:MAG: VOC family protein [Actinomycetota bacterium]